ncbi:hypothetical protein OS493_023718 [Desmophyllum pertusum]|uniref:Uncharacterized protein n=1 Tax=Desmophyllum pertusum TaxID=174260 RepID=A0A9W9YY82_9CNID|nr:hypothetical protein OS493_023718 [Desmophyllum pertusum]
MTEQHPNQDNKNPPRTLKIKSYQEKSGCFGFSRLVGTRPNRQEEFDKLLQSSRYSQLEELYYEHVQRSNKPKLTNVLVQILQIQEVESVQEYTVNGNTFKVHVIEDTEL